MRACPECSQLIHDAATLCRFCKESVPGDVAVAPGWRNFASQFHQVSRREQRGLWQDLGDEERAYAQRVLGVEPPERFGFTSRPRKRAESTLQSVLDLAGSQLRRLLTGYVLLFIVSLGLAAGVLLLRFLEVPGLASQSLILSAAAVSESLDRHRTVDR